MYDAPWSKSSSQFYIKTAEITKHNRLPVLPLTSSVFEAIVRIIYYELCPCHWILYIFCCFSVRPTHQPVTFGDP